MDWEAPADAWYVWLAVSIISLVLAGVVLGLPTGPPPDANQAANAIERTTGATYDASATYDHDADEVKIDGPTISLRNEHGTSRASVTYGHVVPVMGRERLEAIAHGASLEEEYEDVDPDDVDGAFLADLVAAHDETAGEWNTTNGELAVRTLTLEAETGPPVALDGSTDVVDGSGHKAASEVTMRYTAESGTELELDVSGRKFGGNQPAERDGGPVPADGSRRYHEIDLTDGENDYAYALRYPFDVDVYTDGTLECTGEVDGDSGYEPICEGGPLAGDTASDVERIAHSSEAGTYRVTLVTA